METDKKQNRKTHADRARELASMGALKTRLVDEEGLSIYLSIPVSTLQNARGRLPKKWTKEALMAEMEKEFVSPPFIKVGEKSMYDLYQADQMIPLYPKWGVLPEEMMKEVKD